MTLWTPAQSGEVAHDPAIIGRRVFGQHLGADAAFELIDRGLEISVLDNFLQLFPGAGPEISTILHLSDRSLARRRSQGRLTPAESDRLFRLVEMYSLATRVLESAEAADEWMGSQAAAWCTPARIPPLPFWKLQQARQLETNGSTRAWGMKQATAEQRLSQVLAAVAWSRHGHGMVTVQAFRFRLSVAPVAQLASGIEVDGDAAVPERLELSGGGRS